MADDSRPPSSSDEYRRDPGRGASQGASGSGEGSGGGGNYSDEELERYFNDPRRREGPGAERSGSAGGSESGFSEASASASSGEEYAPPGSGSSSGGGGDAFTPGGGARPPGASGGGKESGGGNGNGGDTPWSHRQRPRRGLRGFFHRRLGPKKAQAAFAVSLVAGAALLGVLALGGYFAWQITSDNLPSTKQIENPELDQATV
ncbi:MAG: hypothetical protein BRD40_01100, partial [Bacteroidetes bacterium QS_1_65_9]